MFNTSLRFDNYGTRYTGSDRATANINLNNLTGYGDQLSLSATRATNGDYRYITLIWTILYPLAWVGYVPPLAILTTGLVKNLKTLDAKGDAHYWKLNLLYPLIRTRNQRLYLTASYDRKNLPD